MTFAIIAFTLMCFLFVIAALLRQLNKEREERYQLMDRFSNVAMQIRWKEHYPEEPQVWFDPNNPSSVQDVEGAL